MNNQLIKFILLLLIMMIIIDSLAQLIIDNNITTMRPFRLENQTTSIINQSSMIMIKSLPMFKNFFIWKQTINNGHNHQTSIVEPDLSTNKYENVNKSFDSDDGGDNDEPTKQIDSYDEYLDDEDVDATNVDDDDLIDYDYYNQNKILPRRIREYQQNILILPNRVKKPLIEAHQHQIYSDVNAIDGRLIRLPCFVRPLNPSDSISLVLWYRGDDISGTPIYSVDARHQPFEYAQHFIHKTYQHKQLMNFTLNQLTIEQQSLINHTDNDSHSNYSKIDFNSQTTSMPTTLMSSSSSSPTTTKPISKSTAHLYLMPIEEKDSGLYWCRVDYKWERTTISTVTLNVIVPPKQLQILLKLNKRNYFYAPKANNHTYEHFNGKSSSLKLASTVTNQPHSMTSNDLIIKSIEPNQTIVLNEDESATLICLSEGGKPLPVLNWYRNDELIRQKIYHILTEKNHTLQSELHLTPITIYDHNCWFKCLSSNDNQTFLSAKTLIKVNTKPKHVQIVAYPSSASTTSSSSTKTTESDNDNESKAKSPTSSWLQSGQEIIIRCRSFGSRPPANHSWYRMPGYRPIPILQQYVIISSGKKANNSTLKINENDYDIIMQQQHNHSDTKNEVVIVNYDDLININQINNNNFNLNEQIDNFLREYNIINNHNNSIVEPILITESIIKMKLQIEDNDNEIICNARNLLFNNNIDYVKQQKQPIDSMEQSLRLNVAFAPKVTLFQHLDENMTKLVNAGGYAIRGKQLQLHCNISSNPIVSSDDIQWYKDSMIISDNMTSTNDASLKFSDNRTKLLIDKITDEWNGFYQCIAQNAIGTGFSNQFQIQILYEPNCVTPTQTIPAYIGSVVTMICEVDANPTNVTFLWRTKHQELSYKFDHQQYNDNEPNKYSTETSILISNSFINSLDEQNHLDDDDEHHQFPNAQPFSRNSNHRKIIRNRLEMRIESADDYGQYQCWARNLAGDQIEPCFYNIYENQIKHQLICDTRISFELIKVECKEPKIYSSSSSALNESNMMNNMQTNDLANMIDKKFESDPNHYFDHQHHQYNDNHNHDHHHDSHMNPNPSIHYNLKIFKEKRQLINITSIEPKFLVHVYELGHLKQNQNYESSELKEYNFNDSTDSNNHTNIDVTYLMHISALINGRSISDINLSFRIPSSSMLRLKSEFSNDFDLTNNFINQSTTIPRYKKISAHHFNQTINRTNSDDDSDEQSGDNYNNANILEDELTKTNRAAHRTTITLKTTEILTNIANNIPFLWIIIISVILLLLIVSLSITTLFIRKMHNNSINDNYNSDSNNNNHNIDMIKFTINDVESSSKRQSFKTVRFDNHSSSNIIKYDSNMENEREQQKDSMNDSLINYQSHLFNDNAINNDNDAMSENNIINDNEHQSIKLFTLTSFDANLNRHALLPSSSSSSSTTITFRQKEMLPDLMMDTLQASNCYNIHDDNVSLKQQQSRQLCDILCNTNDNKSNTNNSDNDNNLSQHTTTFERSNSFRMPTNNGNIGKDKTVDQSTAPITSTMESPDQFISSNTTTTDTLIDEFRPQHDCQNSHEHCEEFFSLCGNNDELIDQNSIKHYNNSDRSDTFYRQSTNYSAITTINASSFDGLSDHTKKNDSYIYLSLTDPVMDQFNASSTNIRMPKHIYDDHNNKPNNAILSNDNIQFSIINNNSKQPNGRRASLMDPTITNMSNNQTHRKCMDLMLQQQQHTPSLSSPSSSLETENSANNNNNTMIRVVNLNAYNNNNHIDADTNHNINNNNNKSNDQIDLTLNWNDYSSSMYNQCITSNDDCKYRQQQHKHYAHDYDDQQQNKD